MVNLYKWAIDELIASHSASEMAASEDLLFNCNLLKRLYEINETASMIKYDQFYIKALTTDGTNLFEDYKNWRFSTGGFQQGNSPNVADSSKFSFCNYPFVYDSKAKATLLKGDIYTLILLYRHQSHFSCAFLYFLT